MISTQTEPSSTSGQKTKHFFFFQVALLAIFLLGVARAQQPLFTSDSVIFAAQSTTSSTALSPTNAFGGFESLGTEPVFVSGDTLLAAAPPHAAQSQTFGVSASSETASTGRGELQKYEVQGGDTLSSVAEHFGISVDTLVWANELSRTSTLKVGQELLILPVSGTLHLVRSNETLSGIAALYEASTEEIRTFNHLESADQIYQGDLLIIPGGKEPARASFATPIANSYFIYPVPAPHRVTQGLHAYNAIDFSNGQCADPVYAAAGGKIQKTGYHSIAGNYVRVLHPNGVVTFYGHLGQILVSPGQQVLQGQVIGRTGYSGYTIPAGPLGCHLHFEVRGARNPFAS